MIAAPLRRGAIAFVWLVPLIGAAGTIIASENQRKAAEQQRAAAEAAARAKEKEIEMQYAMLREQQETMKQVLLYAGAGLGGLMLLRGLTR